MGVQAFRPELAVQGFDVGVIRRFAWAREVEHDAAAVCPQIEVL